MERLNTEGCFRILESASWMVNADPLSTDWCTANIYTPQGFTATLKAMFMQVVAMVFTCGILPELCWVKYSSARRLLTFSSRVMDEWSSALKRICIMQPWPEKERLSHKTLCCIKNLVK